MPKTWLKQGWEVGKGVSGRTGSQLSVEEYSLSLSRQVRMERVIPLPHFACLARASVWSGVRVLYITSYPPLCLTCATCSSKAVMRTGIIRPLAGSSYHENKVKVGVGRDHLCTHGGRTIPCSSPSPPPLSPLTPPPRPLLSLPPSPPLSPPTLTPQLDPSVAVWLK